MSNAKAERNAQAYEQITAVLTAVGRPMTLHEISSHAMLRPLNASTRSIAQWLISMRDKGAVSKRGSGSKRATYTIAVPRERVVKAVAPQRLVTVRVGTDGRFRSVQAPEGMEIALEIVAS